MNSKEYIASGILDLYVSGLLSIEEMRDVELNACQNADVKTELESLQLTFEHFAMKHAMMPRAELKSRIMKAIADKSDGVWTLGGSQSSAFSKESSAQKMQPVEKPSSAVVRELPTSGANYSRLVAAASILLLAVMSGFAFYFYSEYNKALEQVAQLEGQQLSIQKQMDNFKTAMNQNAEKMQVITDANTVRITLKGTDKSPASMALIYWNKETKSVYLDIKALPPTAADKQYQLWFIDPKNGPVSAGVFDLKTGELLKMTDAPDAAAFAVTLEPLGGSVNPTLDQMYVVGNVSS